MLRQPIEFTQYTSAEYQALLATHGLVSSMSRKGYCWDNAVMERFFLNLKMERVWQKNYASHSEATNGIADYIVGFYNSIRLHSKLGNLSPNALKRQSTSKNLSNCPQLLDHYALLCGVAVPVLLGHTSACLKRKQPTHNLPSAIASGRYQQAPKNIAAVTTQPPSHPQSRPIPSHLQIPPPHQLAVAVHQLTQSLPIDRPR